MPYNFNTRHPQTPIVQSQTGNALVQAGQQLVSEAMLKSREERVNKWALEAEGRQNERQDTLRGEKNAREDKRLGLLDERYRSEQDYKRDRDLAEDEYRDKTLSGQQAGRASAASDRDLRRQFEQQKHEQGLLKPINSFTDESGRRMMTLADGSVVPAMETVPGEISTNEAAFNAPIGGKGDLNQYGYQDAGKKQVYEAKKEGSLKTGKQDNSQYNAAVKYIDAYNKRLENFHKPTDEEKRQYDYAQRLVSEKMGYGSAPAKKGTQNTPESFIARMEKAGLSEEEVKEGLRQKFPNYNKANPQQGVATKTVEPKAKSPTHTPKMHSPEITAKINSLVGWQSLLGIKPLDFSEEDKVFAKEVLANPDKYESNVVDAANKALKKGKYGRNSGL